MTGSSPAKRLDFFERNLSLWVLACMAGGLAAGRLFPDLTVRLAHWEFGENSHVNVLIAVLIWLMIYPMMLKIDFGGLPGLAKKPRGLMVTLFVNWLVKPFSMALLGWLFVQWLLGSVLGWIEPETAKNYTAGLIILAAAPCTAMVFGCSYGPRNLTDVGQARIQSALV
jgi:ACR3 family arsenite transporter